MDEVQRMVRAACRTVDPDADSCEWPKCGCLTSLSSSRDILAALIASTREEAVREERERCAKVADNAKAALWNGTGHARGFVHAKEDIAAAIRRLTPAAIAAKMEAEDGPVS